MSEVTEPKPLDVSVRLAKTYDATLLRRDLEALHNDYRFLPQPGVYHKGEWAGMSFVAPGGRWNWAGNSMPSVELSAETEILQHAPYFKQVLDDLKCVKLSARMLALAPGGKIKPHQDSGFGFANGMLRLHIPVITDPRVEFFIDGQRVHWNPGELWYGDFSCFHSLNNRSDITRYHLVMDVGINDFVLSLFPPEFTEQVKLRPLKIYEPALKLSSEELQSYECEFEIPPVIMQFIELTLKFREAAGKQDRMTETDWTRAVETTGHGAVRLVNDTLMFLADGRPACAFEPIRHGEVRAVGLPKYTFKFERDGEKVSVVHLLSADDLLVSLPAKNAEEAARL